MVYTSYSVDARIPVSDSVSLSDPTHPKNVVKDAMMVQNQASADTKYDAYPPPRVAESEGFANQSYWSANVILIVFIGILLATVYTVAKEKESVAYFIFFLITMGFFFWLTQSFVYRKLNRSV